MKSKLSLNSSFLTFFILVGCFRSIPTHCAENSSGSPPLNENPRYLSFIAARMNHLTAINDIKQLANSVKRHQLILDLSKKTFNVLDESRRRLTGHGNKMDLSVNDPNTPYIINYLENTAFFCDLLVFFPEITSRLLDANLLWRITLIDSIQDATSFYVSYLDENTLTQFSKAYTILSEGTVSTTKSTQDKKDIHTKKLKRKPRLSMNEL